MINGKSSIQMFDHGQEQEYFFLQRTKTNSNVVIKFKKLSTRNMFNGKNLTQTSIMSKNKNLSFFQRTTTNVVIKFKKLSSRKMIAGKSSTQTFCKSTQTSCKNLTMGKNKTFLFIKEQRLMMWSN
jgi:TfoX/Sxy family transcriptional regulator of competence genes